MSRKSFKDAYGVLQRHSEALRNQREPNIDDLLAIVTESVEAYKEINNDKTETRTLVDLVKTPAMSDWSLFPQGTMKFAEHLHRIGTLKTMPKSFKDYYLPTVHGMAGN